MPFSEKHLTAQYVEWLNDPDLMRFSEQRHKKHTLASCRAYWQSFAQTANRFWAIEEIEIGLGHIGNLNAYVDGHNLVADMGLLVGSKQAHNKGYGREAWLCGCVYLLEKVGVRKVTGGALALNTAMLKIMEHAGMVNDGIRKRHYLVDGQEVDVVHKALFRESWKEGKPEAVKAISIY